jgi:hypothetical protein
VSDDSNADITIVSAAALPRYEDNIERIVRYDLAGRPDFEFDFGGRRTWAPADLTIMFHRRTIYRGGLIFERTEWRLTNVHLHAWLRLKSGGISNKVDLLADFEDLPREFVDRYVKRDTACDYLDLKQFPYVAEMIDACRPAFGELV